ncbi:hypothetical protein F4823DRAFT_617226 [Ustulina deusta]|nr:hypothetical protein F4823DRAFT_617226 [Ustulina deusta]
MGPSTFVSKAKDTLEICSSDMNTSQTSGHQHHPVLTAFFTQPSQWPSYRKSSPSQSSGTISIEEISRSQHERRKMKNGGVRAKSAHQAQKTEEPTIFRSSAREFFFARATGFAIECGLVGGGSDWCDHECAMVIARQQEITLLDMDELTDDFFPTLDVAPPGYVAEIPLPLPLPSSSDLLERLPGDFCKRLFQEPACYGNDEIHNQGGDATHTQPRGAKALGGMEYWIPLSLGFPVVLLLYCQWWWRTRDPSVDSRARVYRPGEIWNRHRVDKANHGLFLLRTLEISVIWRYHLDRRLVVTLSS